MTAIDPVCGNRVKAEDRPSHEHAGRVFVFCSIECRLRFAADPGRWTSSRLALPDELLRETEALLHRWFG